MRTVIVTATLASLLLGACRKDQPDDQPTGSVTDESIRQARANWPAGVSELIDSANAAYSAQDYEQANQLFRRAAETGPKIPAVWFGIYMAEHARGNVAAADSAMARAQALAPEASLIHGTPADTASTGGVHP